MSRLRSTALLLLLAATSGCLFQTRTPEDPAGSEIPFLTPVSESLVLENIKVTLIAKSLTNYERSLADSFAFVADPADSSLIGGGFFRGWNKQRELNAIGEVLKTSGTATFAWTPAGGTLPVQGDPDARFYEDLAYRMTFTRVDADTTVSGKVDLYLREANGLWSVYMWVDKRDGSKNQTLGWYRWKGRIVF